MTATNHWNMLPRNTPEEQAAYDASLNDVDVAMDFADMDDAEYPVITTTRYGYLTTSHAASSYGIPVLVLLDWQSALHSDEGGVRGVADLPAGARIYVSTPSDPERQDAANTLIASAVAAGYPIVNR